ncbi:MAG: SLC13 family permease, partial [Calditrichia bacterium]
MVIFVLILLQPTTADFTSAERNMLAVAALMAIWWMTEALPLAVTSLLPLALYPVLGIMRTSVVSPNYTNHLIFLFMGGFIIAIALQEWQLHRRFALHTISLLGSNPRQLVLAFMLSTAVLSMWISNTATTIMMLPIGMAVIHQLRGNLHKETPQENRFGTVLMLGIAYSASIGGIATIIGTPPNVIFTGIYAKFFPFAPEISFVRWMLMALPLSALLFTVIWGYLSYVVLRKKDLPEIVDKQYFEEQRKSLQPLNSAQKLVLAIFLVTAFLWIFRADINFGVIRVPGWPTLIGLRGRIQDSTIAMGMAILLFIIPARHKGEKRALLKWNSLLELPWDILLLFGGGFALADGIQSTGLANFLGHKLTFLGNMPLFIMLLLLSFSVALLTEFTSNTAVATTILPVLGALAIDLDINPLIIMFPATVAASCAFMLPVSTPPNAIVFGSRYIPIRRMVRIGIVLILLASVIVAAYCYFLFHVFGF